MPTIWHLDGARVGSDEDAAQEAREAAAARMRKTVPENRSKVEIPEHLQSWGQYGSHAWEQAKEQATDMLHRPEYMVGTGGLGEVGAPLIGAVRGAGRVPRYGGPTQFEQRGIVKAPKVLPPGPVTLEKTRTVPPSPRVGTIGGMSDPQHFIAIKDAGGKTVGAVILTEEKAGKKMYIDYIEAGGNEGGIYNYLGLSRTRSIFRDLKTMFPEATEIGGFRVGGAREKAGTMRDVNIEFQKVEHDPFKE